jgi:hypothetical protein
MDRADLLNGIVPRPIIAKGERQHCPDGVVQSDDGSEGAGSKRAVLRHPGCNERVSQLQQNCARPAEQHQSLSVDLARNGH